MKGFAARRGRMPRSPRTRPTLRLRLALLYGGLVLLACAALLGLTYVRVGMTSRAATVAVARPPYVRIGGTGAASPRSNTPAQTTVRRSIFTADLPLFLMLGRALGGGGSVVVAPVPTSPETPAQMAQVLRRSIAQQKALDQSSVLVQGAIALGFVVVLAFVVGWLVAGRILRPLQVMTSTARRLSAEDLSGRIALPGPKDELKNLADTFDALLGRLDTALSAERRFVANVSHELRTPLAVQKTMLEVALSDPNADVESLRELAGRMWQLNQRSRRLIDGLLELARSQRGVESAVPVELAGVVRDAVDTATPELAALNLHLELDLQDVRVLGDRVLLERLAGNLIENAGKYNAPEGWVRVATLREGGSAVLVVENSGAMFPPEQVETLFQPFQRGVQERTETSRGAGLGLSIVRAVAQAHHGEADAAARRDGGLRVTVTLPAL